MTTGRSGTVAACLVVRGPGAESVPAQTLELDFNGVVGDRHAGLTRAATSREPWYPRGTVIRNDRQVSIVSDEELVGVAALMDLARLEPAWIGANLALAGIADLSALPPGTRIVFAGGVVLRLEAENGPCRIAGGAIAAHVPEREGLDLLFPKVAKHKRGVVASVEKPGTIAVGESVSAHLPALRFHPAAGELL